MRMIVCRTICIVVALATYVSPTLGGDDQIPRLTPEEFPILAWNIASGDKQVFETIRECGFNLAGFVRPNDLDNVAAAELKCIVHDPRTPIRRDAQLKQSEIDEQVKIYTDRVGTHPAVFGYYLKDEPNAKDFAVLARWAKAFKVATPDKISYVNIFPNYAKSRQLGTDTYEYYVESFIKTLKLPFLSYDHYALMEDGTLRKGYFSNLEVVRKACLRHKIPFWNTVLSTACVPYAKPTEVGLRFQTYTSLAYGAGGITWFTYFSQTVGNFRMAPIDQFGHKTPTWDMLRRVNLQIHRLGPTYLKLKSVNVFHHPEAPEGCQGIETSKHLSEISGGNLLVGEFVNADNRPAVIVVNKDLRQSACLKLAFRSTGKIRKTNAYLGVSQNFSGEHSWLAPGQGVLLTLEPTEEGK